MTTHLPSTIPSPAEGQDLASVPMKFEVTPIPVADFDRAKAFYQRLGWRLDIDLQFTEQVRGVQFTPPGSPASIQFAPAGAERLQRLLLIVEDIDAARQELVDRRIEVSAIFHALPGAAPQPGRDPNGRSYVSQATFSDPDGNLWVLQEVTERIPGRGWATAATAESTEAAGGPGANRGRSTPDWLSRVEHGKLARCGCRGRSRERVGLTDRKADEPARASGRVRLARWLDRRHPGGQEPVAGPAG